MKTLKQLFIILYVMAVLIAGCASGGNSKTTGPVSLDTAIQQSSNEVSATLPEGSKVALLNFTSESNQLTDYVLEEMSICLVKERKLVVVDRKEIDLVRKELNFQNSGEVSDESAQEIGKMLGAQSIISGSFVNIGDTYRFRTKVINVNSAAIETSSSISVKGDSQIQHLMGNSANTGSSSTSRTTTASSSNTNTRSQGIQITIANNTGNSIIGAFLFPNGATRESQVTEIVFNENLDDMDSLQYTLPSLDTTRKYQFQFRDINRSLYIVSNITLAQNMSITVKSSDKYVIYKVGDTGPAGGIIFYDKKNNSGGWRYLEAAPVEAEFRAIFSVSGSLSPYGRMEDSIGSGKNNTKLIVEKSKQIAGEWETAARITDELVLNGFDDWFIPSIDELNQMYGNLKRKNLGDFNNGRYWSSTDFGYYTDPQSGVKVQNFEDGNITYAGRHNNYYVRPIRQFPES
jgi:TolB-like protein